MNKTEFLNQNYNSSDELMSLAAYVLISSYRERTMTVLFNNGAMTPKFIAANAGFRPNHVSKVLGELKEKELVVCINEEVRKGRLYRLTNLGREIFPILTELKGVSGSELNDCYKGDDL